MIYISGKMTGVKDYNYLKFNAVARNLRAKGHMVCNPAEIEIDTTAMPETQIWQSCMDIYISKLDFCDTIYMLKGWEKSRGAKTELKHAIEVGLVIELET